MGKYGACSAMAMEKNAPLIDNKLDIRTSFRNGVRYFVLRVIWIVGIEHLVCMCGSYFRGDR